MSPHCCITSAFQASSPLHWDTIAPNLADPAEGQYLQLTPLPSIQLASNPSLFGTLDLAHIFDSDSDNDDLLPSPVAVNDPVMQQQVVPPAVKQEQSLRDINMVQCTTTSSDAGAAVALLKQKQSSSAPDHMRTYLAQLSDVQFTLRERAALVATIPEAPADISEPGKHEQDPAFDSDNSDEEDEEEQTEHDYSDSEDQQQQHTSYLSRPAKRRSSFNLQGQAKSPRTDAGLPAAPALAAAAPPTMVLGIAATTAYPPVAAMQAQVPAAAADDRSHESTLQYLAQLSDVQARLHQNATLAATLHGPASQQRQQQPAPVSAPAGSNPSSPSRKRHRGSAADVSVHLQPAAAAAAAAAAGVAALLPQSSFKGVEYLPAEGKWQAYMYDSTLGEVVFLDKYEHELDAALAHDREMVKRLGAAATAHQLNFTSSRQDPLHAAALTAALAIQLAPFNSSMISTVASKSVSAAAAASSSSVAGPVERQRHAAAAAWAAVHEAQAAAPVPQSSFKGVEYLPAEGKWQAYMLDTNINQVVWLDKYSDELSAARAHDAAVINKLGAAAALAAGQINFTDQIPPAALQQTREPTPPRLSIAPLQLHGSTAAPAQTGAAAAASGDGDSPAASPTGRSRGSGRAARGAQGAKPISQYKGVSWSSSCHKWAAVIWDRLSKKARHVGVYGSEEEAARAYDREVITAQGAKNTGLNFRNSVDLYRAEVGEPPAAAETAATASKPNSSEYRGVSWHERSKRWEARAWGSGRQHFVGSFSSAIDAARAYDKAILKLGGAGPKSASRLNFPLTDYDLQEIASMNFPVNNPNKKPAAKRSRKQAAAAAQDSDDE